MERKRTRSSSGTAGFSASDMTRQLKASQLSSRLMKRSGPVMSKPGRPRPWGGTACRKSASTSRSWVVSTFSSILGAPSSGIVGTSVWQIRRGATVTCGWAFSG